MAIKLFGGYSIIKSAMPARGELGAVGNLTFPSGGGIVLADQEYNPEMRGKAFFDQIDRMRFSDAQVKAVMNIVKLPLLAADWGFEPASDSPRDVEIAEWLEERFFNRQMRSWDYTLRHMLLSLDYGSMPFELVWTVSDDDLLGRPMVHLWKMAPRLPRTILEWQLTPEGGLAGIRQQVEKDNQYLEIDIPGDRLLVFTHEMEGSNYRGTSILRQARKDWVIKERLQRLNQVAIEKRASGIDVGRMTEDAGTDQRTRDAFEAVLQSIRTHERGWILTTPGLEYEIAGIQGAVLDPLPSIRYADLMILRCILADFLSIGEGTAGSFALVRDRSSFFLMSLNAIADELRGPINRFLVPKWVNWNWPDVTEYPQLTHSRLDRRDVAVMVDALSKMIPAGIVTPDDEIEREVREWLELPELLDEPVNRETNAPNPNLEDLVDDPSGPQAAQHYRNLRARRGHAHRERISRTPRDTSLRPRTLAERAVNWKILAKALDDTQERIVRVYKPIQSRQINKLIEEGMKAIEAQDMARLVNINVPYKQEAARAVAKPLIDLFRVGQQEVRQEMARMGGEPLRLALPLDPENDQVMMTLLEFRALAMINLLADRLRGSLLMNGLNMIRDGSTDAAVLRGVLTSLSDNVIHNSAGHVVSEALNLGREAVAARNALLITRVRYSAVLDGRACDPCLSLEGTEYIFGTPEYEAAKPPRQSGGEIQECDGRNRCRCIYIYEF